MAIRKNCIVCEKKIFRSSNNNSPIARRSRNAVTCSKPCSRIYARVYRYFRNNLNAQKRKWKT